MRRYSPEDGTGLHREPSRFAAIVILALAIIALCVVLSWMPEPSGADSEWRTGKFTAYCSRCSGNTTATGKHLQPWFVAADRRYHRFGKVIEVEVGGRHLRYRVEDTGGAIRGRDRFDLCAGCVSRCRCDWFGVQRLRYRVVR